MNISLDPKHKSLYQEVMDHCLAIQRILNKYDQYIADISPEECNKLQERFWNEYVYPKYEPIYFELFPADRGKKDNPGRFKADFDIVYDNQKMVVALCEWLKREGCFHFFEGHVIFIDPTPTDLAFLLSDGVPLRSYPPHYVGTLLERVALDCINDHKKIDKLINWIVGLAILAGFMTIFFITTILK